MKYYSTEEVAKKVGVTRQSVWLWIKLGRIKYTMFGKNYYIAGDEVSRLARKRK